MPAVAIVVGLFVLVSLMESYPWLGFIVVGLFVVMVLIALDAPNSDERAERRARERKVARAIDYERERAAGVERALKNAYAQAEARISNMKRNRL